jgi:hypothetical protein
MIARLLELEQREPPMRIEDHLLSVPLTPAQRAFIEDMRVYAERGVDFGWMQQVIEWEWQSRAPHEARGPEYYEKLLAQRTGSPRRTTPADHLPVDPDGAW